SPRAPASPDPPPQAGASTRPLAGPDVTVLESMNDRLTPDLQVDRGASGLLNGRADVGADDYLRGSLRGGVYVVVPAASGGAGATRRVLHVHELRRVAGLVREHEVHTEIVEALHRVARRNLELARQERGAAHRVERGEELLGDVAVRLHDVRV